MICGWDDELDDDPYLTVVCSDFYPAALLMPQPHYQWQLTIRIMDVRRDGDLLETPPELVRGPDLIRTQLGSW